MNMFVRRPALILLLSCGLGAAHADNTPQTLPFTQDWSNAGLITTSDSWSGVPGIEGFRGDGLATTTAVDPQTILVPDAAGVIDVNANQANPNTFTTGGVTEFVLTDNVVALAGSGTARAPYLKIYLNTTGASNVTVAYNLRDVDGSADNAAQPVALQYRIGNTGDFTNVPAAFVADASNGPSLATLVTAVSATLPGTADNQPLVELRIMTTDAVGSDEWIGIDDIAVTAGVVSDDPVLSISDTAAAEGNSGTSPFFFIVSLTQPAGVGGVSFDYATANGTATAGSDYVARAASATIAEGATSVTVNVDVNGDTDTEPNETFFVNVSNIIGALAGDVQGIGTINNDDVTLTPIHTVQGSAQLSPLAGQTVSVEGIVTGRKSNGFFVQSADGEGDGNDATSQGLFVFTGAAPPASAAAGNRVQASGTVVEFIPAADPGQLPLTELGGTISVTLLTIGNPLPTPVQLSNTLPAPGGALDQLERYEGMRVTAPSFTVVAPTGGSTNEPNATGTTNGIFSVVVTGTPRPFREPGIQRPDLPPSGTIPPIPQWDFNPELLTVVSRAIGGTAIDVAAGAQIANLVGPLDYGFRRYTIAPDPAVTPTIPVIVTFAAARAPTGDEFTVATYNMERFFDTANDPDTDDPVLTPAAFANRLNKASLGIRNFLNAPDILGVVEMENLTTLQAVATKVNDDAVAASQPNPGYVAYLEEGNDIGGIDVGFLVKSADVAAGIDRVEVVEVTQLGLDEMWMEPAGGMAILNDRPPLQLDAVVHYADGREFPITAIVVHQRSLNGAEEDSANGLRVRAKRQRQAEYLAEQIDALQTADPERAITVLGDFNAFEFNDGYVDAMNVVTGTPTPDNQTVVPGDGVDLVDPDLLNLFIEEPADQRYTFVFEGNAQSLDHILVNQALGVAATNVTLDHARINADYPEVNRNDANSAVRLSDHDPAVAYVEAEPLTSADLIVATNENGNGPFAAGQPFTFLTGLQNFGPDAADFPAIGFAVDAALPDLSVRRVSGGNSPWTCDAPVVSGNTTTAVCTADTLDTQPLGVMFELTATAPVDRAGQTITQVAAASSQSADPNENNNQDSASIAIVPSSNVSVAINGPSQAARSMTPTAYAVVVANAGPSPLPQSSLRISIDKRRETVSFSVPAGWQCGVAGIRNFQADCVQTGPFANGASATFELGVVTGGRLQPPAFTIRAASFPQAFDPQIDNNAASKRVRVGRVTIP